MGSVEVDITENVLDVTVSDDGVVVEVSHTGPQGPPGPSGSGGGPAKTYVQATDPSGVGSEFIWVDTSALPDFQIYFNEDGL